MSNKFLLFSTVCLICFSACTEKLEINTEECIQNLGLHNITQEQALETLQDYLKDDTDTRTTPKQIGEIFAVNYNSVATRAGVNTNDCENLLYVVNYENGQGYAVLAADDRISERILAITSDGSLSSNILNSTLQANLTDQRIIFEAHPTFRVMEQSCSA